MGDRATFTSARERRLEDPVSALARLQHQLEESRASEAVAWRVVGILVLILFAVFLGGLLYFGMRA